MRKIAQKTDTMKQIETKLGGDIEEILREMYVDKHMSVQDMSTELEISYVTVLKWLKLAGVRSRRLKKVDLWL